VWKSAIATSFGAALGASLRWLPGIKLNTSPTDYTPIKQMNLRRFDGKTWVRLPE